MGFQLHDLSEIEPSTGGGGGFEVIPAGDYRLQADEISEEKATSKGDGKYVTAKFSVIEGENQGASFFVNFNIENPNPKAMEICWRDMSAWGHALSPPVLTGDSDALLYKPFMARVGIEKSTNPKFPDDKNRIVKYYKPGEAPMAAPVTRAAAPGPRPFPPLQGEVLPPVRQAAVNGGAKALPWAKRA